MAVTLFLAASVLSQIVPQTSLVDADTLRLALLEQLLAMESIECSYTYCCSKRAEEQLDRLEMRWKNGWLLWYASRPTNPSDNPQANNLIMESIVDGAVSGYWQSANSSESYYHTNYEMLRFMAYDELSPLTVLGLSFIFSYTRNLRDMLQAETSPYMELRGEQILLFLFPDPPDGDFSENETMDAAIVYFDLEGRVVQVDYVLRPGCFLEEVRLFSKTNSPRDIHRLLSRDVYEDYHNINGFGIPVKLHRMSLWISLTDEFVPTVKELNSLVEENLITLGEFETRLYMAAPGYFIEKEWQVTIDPDSIRINNPNLSKEDFTIIPPKKPTVTRDIASGDFEDKFGEGNYFKLEKETEARRIARMKAKMKKDYSLPIGVAIGAFSAALLATLIVLKMRGKR